MNALLEELIDVFKDQANLHHELIAVLLDEKEAIVGSKLFELNEANREKETLIRKIKRLEDKRVKLVSRLANSLDDQRRDFTLEKLCKTTNEPYSSRLSECRENIKSLLNRVKELNDGNKALLTSSIEVIKNS